jgi:PKD repeat protein
VELSLYNAAGTLVAVSHPSETLGASLYLSGMAAGTYYVMIDGVGANNPATDGYSDYGSIGQYTLTGTIPIAGAPVAMATGTPNSGVVPLVTQLSSLGSFDPDGGAVSFVWTSDDGNTSTSPNPSFTYLTPGTHVATLTVTDDEGMTSVATVQIIALDVPPTAPSALTAAAVSSSQINLQWADNAGNETEFKLERSTDGISFSEIATLGANVTSYSDTGLNGTTTYYYRVRASNASGNSAYSGTASATTPIALPATPSKLTARAASQTQMNLTWQDNATNETGYYVERSANGATGWLRIANLGANAKTYSDLGLTRNTKYYYRVQAYHGGGTSAYSSTVSASTKR